MASSVRGSGSLVLTAGPPAPGEDLGNIYQQVGDTWVPMEGNILWGPMAVFALSDNVIGRRRLRGRPTLPGSGALTGTDPLGRIEVHDLTPTDLPANFQTCSGWGTSDGGTVFIGGGTGDAQNNNNLGYMYRWDRG